MVVDGFWDLYKDIFMGSCVELCVDDFSIFCEVQVFRDVFFFLV